MERMHQLLLFVKNLSKVRKIILIALVVATLFIPALLFFLVKTSETPRTTEESPVIPLEKTWRITVSYHTKEQKLSLENVELLNESIKPDYTRGAAFSTYKLIVFDKDDNPLYTTKAPITEQLLYSILPGKGNIPTPPRVVTTILFIPYQEGNAKIAIEKNGIVVLTILLPKQTSFRLLPKVYAQTESPSCEPMRVAFIGDGYTNEEDYRKDVAFLEKSFKEVEPFRPLAQQMFAFFRIDTTEPFGCINGIYQCNMEKITDAVYRNLPNASKFIVVINNPNAEGVDGRVAGVATLGGSHAIVANRYNVHHETQGSVDFKQTAMHEFLGHSVSVLYDRYVTKDENYGGIISGIKSNCTDNQEGEALWKEAGVTKGFKGCITDRFYAPSEPTCPGDDALLSGGTPESVMSSLGCSSRSSSFDAAERHWIAKTVLQQYLTCPSPSPTITGGPSASITPTVTPSVTPTPPPSSCAGFSEKECKLIEETPVQVGDRTEENRRYECTSGDKTFICVWTTQSDKQSICSFGDDGYNCFKYCDDLTEKFGGKSDAEKAKFHKECFDDHCVNVNTSCPSAAEKCETNSCPSPAVCNKDHTCVTQVTPTPVPASGSSSSVYVCEEIGTPSDNKQLQIQPLRCRPK